MSDLAGGTVQVALDTLGATKSLIKSGRLKLLAVGSLKRLPEFPDVPTISENGYPGFEAVAWIGLTVPAKTPKPIKDKLNEDVRAVLSTAETRAKMILLDAIPRPSSIQEFSALLHSENDRWQEIVKKLGVTAD